MRHLSCGLAIFGTLALGAVVAEADTFAGRADFSQNGTPSERRASWGQADAGACRILDPTITIRKDGTVSFISQVASTHGDDAYCVILDFFNQNQQKLFHFPQICSPTLSDTFREWRRDNLAIPQNIYPFIVFATRQDHC
jgi:hypothetical protein